MTKLHEIFCTCYLWSWLGPAPTTMQYVMYFRFVDDVMFSRNGANTETGQLLVNYSPWRVKWRRGRSVLSTIALVVLVNSLYVVYENEK